MTTQMQAMSRSAISSTPTRPGIIRHSRHPHSSKSLQKTSYKAAHRNTHRLVVCATAPLDQKETSTASPPATDNLSTPTSTTEEITYVEPTQGQRAMTNFRLLFALPWRRFKPGSALTFKLSGQIAEQPQSRFSSTTSLPSITDSLQKAAYDPRIVGVVIKVDPLSCGWGKVIEIRRHLELFQQSGKWAIAYLERAGEKEYFLASACKEVYAPPSASLSLRGLAVSGTFLRGVLDKIGVEPEIRRIGKYKSAGDQILRKDMSDAQREQLTELLDDIYDGFVNGVATARGKTKEDVEALLDAGVFDMEEYKADGWVDDLKYEDEINDIVKERTGGKEDELRCVGLKKYAKVGRSAFGLNGKKVIAIVRTSGAIVAGSSSSSGGNITAGAVIQQLRALKKNKKIAAVVLRVDSPGGDALASDLMWREIQKLSEEKPVIASMADVAASGGYYMSMACQKIVAEALTLTGSIGVVTGKFNLAELYEKAGYNKQMLSKGKFAELLAESRAFTEEEAALFDKAAQHAYEQFRNKAAKSRSMEIEAMQEVAQGRVWSGKRAATMGLVDAIGGLNKAVALAKEAAGLKEEDKVTLLEVSRASVSPLSLLSGSGASVINPLVLMSVLQQLVGGAAAHGVGNNPLAIAAGAPALMNVLLSSALGTSTDQVLIQGLNNGAVMAQIPEVSVEGVSSQSLLQLGDGNAIGYSELFDCE